MRRRRLRGAGKGRADDVMLAENLAISTAMVVLTILIHFFGLAVLLLGVREVSGRARDTGTVLFGAAAIVMVVVGLVGLHTVEIWSYAAVYMLLGEFSSLEDALYFSTSTFSTVGYGDLTLSERHRLVGAIEGAVGFLMIGWSTAFLVTVTARMGLLEAQIERMDRRKRSQSKEAP